MAATQVQQRHPCPVCGSTFTRPQHVVRHLRSHTGERPYKCKECGDSFARSDLLSRHVNKCHPHLVPSNGQPFSARAPKRKPPCDQCIQNGAKCDAGTPCTKCVSQRIKCSRTQKQDSALPSSSLGDASAHRRSASGFSDFSDSSSYRSRRPSDAGSTASTATSRSTNSSVALAFDNALNLGPAESYVPSSIPSSSRLPILTSEQVWPGVSGLTNQDRGLSQPFMGDDGGQQLPGFSSGQDHLLGHQGVGSNSYSDGGFADTLSHYIPTHQSQQHQPQPSGQYQAANGSSHYITSGRPVTTLPPLNSQQSIVSVTNPYAALQNPNTWAQQNGSTTLPYPQLSFPPQDQLSQIQPSATDVAVGRGLSLDGSPDVLPALSQSVSSVESSPVPPSLGGGIDAAVYGDEAWRLKGKGSAPAAELAYPQQHTGVNDLNNLFPAPPSSTSTNNNQIFAYAPRFRDRRSVLAGSAESSDVERDYSDTAGSRPHTSSSSFEYDYDSPTSQFNNNPQHASGTGTSGAYLDNLHFQHPNPSPRGGYGPLPSAFDELQLRPSSSSSAFQHSSAAASGGSPISQEKGQDQKDIQNPVATSQNQSQKEEDDREPKLKDFWASWMAIPMYSAVSEKDAFIGGGKTPMQMPPPPTNGNGSAIGYPTPRGSMTIPSVFGPPAAAGSAAGNSNGAPTSFHNQHQQQPYVLSKTMSLPSIKTPTTEFGARRGGLGVGFDSMITPRAGGVNVNGRYGPSVGGQPQSSDANAEDLRKYQEACLAREAPVLKLAPPRARGFGSGSGRSPNGSSSSGSGGSAGSDGSSNPNSPDPGAGVGSVSAISDVRSETGPHSHSLSNGAVSRPNAGWKPPPPQFNATAPETPLAKSNMTGQLGDPRPSYKRLPSQTLGPELAKRTTYGLVHNNNNNHHHHHHHNRNSSNGGGVATEDEEVVGEDDTDDDDDNAYADRSIVPMRKRSQSSPSSARPVDLFGKLRPVPAMPSTAAGANVNAERPSSSSSRSSFNRLAFSNPKDPYSASPPVAKPTTATAP